MLIVLILFSVTKLYSQKDSLEGKLRDTVVLPKPDTSLRIINLNPYFTLHVDSTLGYQLASNKNGSDYYWYLKGAPVGLRINKGNGTLSFKADKAYFLSGKLKYDQPYKVMVGVQNLIQKLFFQGSGQLLAIW